MRVLIIYTETNNVCTHMRSQDSKVSDHLERLDRRQVFQKNWDLRSSKRCEEREKIKAL